MESEPSGKRIVSKAEYVKAQAKRLGWVCSGIIIVVSVLLVAASILAALSTQNTHFPVGMRREDYWSLLTVLLSLAFVCIFLRYMSRIENYIVGKFTSIDPGVPLTHANATHLPAPDTLVRASVEPTQEQHAVLLRAAAAGQQTPPEQLVRASSIQVDSS